MAVGGLLALSVYCNTLLSCESKLLSHVDTVLIKTTNRYKAHTANDNLAEKKIFCKTSQLKTKMTKSVFEIRRGTEDNSEINFLLFQYCDPLLSVSWF